MECWMISWNLGDEMVCEPLLFYATLQFQHETRYNIDKLLPFRFVAYGNVVRRMSHAICAPIIMSYYHLFNGQSLASHQSSIWHSFGQILTFRRHNTLRRHVYSG